MSFRYCLKFDSITLFALFLTTMFISFTSALNIKAETAQLKSIPVSNKLLSSDELTTSINIDQYANTLDSINDFKTKAVEMSGKLKEYKINFNGFKQYSLQVNKAIIILLALSSLFIVLILALSSNINSIKYEDSKHLDINLKQQTSEFHKKIQKHKEAKKEIQNQNRNVNIEMSKESKNVEKYSSEKSPHITNHITKDITFNEEFHNLLGLNEKEISRSINDTFDYDDKEDFRDIISFI